jgi:hypothetical protein
LRPAIQKPNGTPELYHLGNDPPEQTDLVAREPERVNALAAQFAAARANSWRPSLRPHHLPSSSVVTAHAGPNSTG